MSARELDFEAIWADHVMPLQGKMARGMNGLENVIRTVDSTGVDRLSRNGLASHIPIEPFRWTVERLLAGRPTTRVQINERFPRRYSSGVFLVLEQVPLFEASGRPKSLRLRPATRAAND